MNEKKEFQKMIRKINHAREKEGKTKIQYAVDFGETIHVSDEWAQLINPIIRSILDRRNRCLETYQKTHSR